jgi:hypothetical protein
MKVFVMTMTSQAYTNRTGHYMNATQGRLAPAGIDGVSAVLNL